MTNEAASGGSASGGSASGGTGTFLFTDIEGSTKLEVELGTERYAELRERHRELLRAAFEAHGGHEQRTEGDAFFVVFPSAREAVAAAVDGQRALATEAWPDDAAVRVRIGINSGDYSRAGGDLVGLAINRAARVAAAAHGGQTVVSETTRGLVGDGLPPDVTLRDLGEHRLKDLRAPEHLFQVLGPGLASEFPAIRSLDARPNNLPVQLTTFVGRERELAEGLDLLRATRLLTLTGPGGTGKTRLSLQIAASAADDFPNGIWFIPLEPIRNAELFVPTIARVLGIADRADRSAMDAVVESIGDGRVLLVLDNFEQVIDAAPLVGDLLRRCPRLVALVTSRAVLHVSGEQEYPVPGLPAPPDLAGLSEMDRLNLPANLRQIDPETLSQYESVRLFIARATSVRPGFQVTNANAPAVAQICASLHGMPLAIELAAARVKLLSPEQILARLSDRLALLSAGSRDLPQRQQTLRGAIAWSYDLLEPADRRLFERFSVHSGGAFLTQADAVCGPASELGEDVLDGLSSLADQSLIRMEEVDEVVRFVMLDTIRDYAAEQLTGRGEADAIRDRHLVAFADLAERAAPQLSGADQREWLDRLERDHGNIRAALDWAIARPNPELAVRLAFAIWRLWQQRGYLNEGRDRLAAIVAQGWQLEPVTAARLAEACGGVAYWQADYEAAIKWYAEALRLWREVGDEREIANALYNRAYGSLIRIMFGAEPDGSDEEARDLLLEALATYERLGDERGKANINWALGSHLYFTDRTPEAEPWFRKSLELHRTTGQRTMEAWSLHMLAMTLLRQDRIEEGRAEAIHALRHFHDSGDVAGITLVLDDLAVVALALDDRPKGARLWGAARRLQSTTGVDLATFVGAAFKAAHFLNPEAVIAPDDLGRWAAEGAAMGLDEVVRYALEDPTPAVP
ncbi:MAG: ATP-binding protein [Chloroflexota bacterium]